MKGLKERAIVLILAPIISFAPMTGCFLLSDQNPEKDPPFEEVDPGNENENQNGNNNENTTKPVEPPVVEEPKDEFSKISTEMADVCYDFVDSLAEGNFTYQLQVGPKDNKTLSTTYIESNNKIAQTANSKTTYYSREDGVMYQFAKSDGKWFKTLYEGTDMLNVVESATDALEPIYFGTYNPVQNIAKGYVDIKGFRYEASFNNNLNLLKIERGEEAGFFYDVGRTSVSLPREFVDNTKQGEDLKLTQDGKTVLNMKAIVETLENWMIENEILSKLNYNIKEFRLMNLVYFDTKTNAIGTISHNTDNPYFAIFTLKADLAEEIENGTLKTTEDLKEFLESNSTTLITKQQWVTKYEYTTLDENYAENKADFEKVAENAFKRLATVGYQKTSINDEGIKVEGYENAKVLFGYKTQNGSTTAGADMGFIQGWNVLYVVEVNGRIEIVKMNIAGKDNSKTPLENVLEDVENGWMIGAFSAQEISAENAQLFGATREKEIQK